MREILFRGKRVDNGEWVEGFLVKHPSTVHIGDYSPWYISVPPKDPDDNGGLYNVDPETVGEFIGLTDKNGKKIFEGDILREWCEGMEEYVNTCVVEYDMFNCTCCDGVYGWEFRRGDIRDYERYEVFGNIHDNPELLEV